MPRPYSINRLKPLRGAIVDDVGCVKEADSEPPGPIDFSIASWTALTFIKNNPMPDNALDYALPPAGSIRLHMLGPDGVIRCQYHIQAAQ